jgi:two-component system, OmpR family, sensor histidine kinase KdpD
MTTSVERAFFHAGGRNAGTPFEMASTAVTGSRRDGVGLGLAVANGFVRAMGGTLTFGETPGGGLTAIVQLPRRTAPDVDAPEPSAP